jgi:hypothetical protein
VVHVLESTARGRATTNIITRFSTMRTTWTAAFKVTNSDGYGRSGSSVRGPKSSDQMNMIFPRKSGPFTGRHGNGLARRHARPLSCPGTQRTEAVRNQYS